MIEFREQVFFSRVILQYDRLSEFIVDIYMIDDYPCVDPIIEFTSIMTAHCWRTGEMRSYHNDENYFRVCSSPFYTLCCQSVAVFSILPIFHRLIMHSISRLLNTSVAKTLRARLVEIQFFKFCLEFSLISLQNQNYTAKNWVFAHKRRNSLL